VTTALARILLNVEAESAAHWTCWLSASCRQNRFRRSWGVGRHEISM